MVDLALKVGDEVYWHDPDKDGDCSDYGIIIEIAGDIFRIKTGKGSEIEAFRHELS